MTDSSDYTTVDVNDPCALAAFYKLALLKLYSGQGEIRVIFKDGDSMQDVTYGQPNIAALETKSSKQDALCLASKGGRPRFCARAG